MSESVQPGVVRWTFPKDSVTFNPDGSVSVAGRTVQDDGLPDRLNVERMVAINHLRRIVDARELAWLDDEIGDAAKWLAERDAALRAAPPLHDPQEPADG